MTDGHMIDETELVQLIRSFEGESDLFSDQSNTVDGMDAYLGAPNGRERDGYSKVTTREVLETVETVVPYLMKLYFSGDEVVRFEPEGEEDIPRAQQETDYVNWVFSRKNRGFCIGETAIRDALLSRIGVAKVYYEESNSKTRVSYHNKSLEELALIADNPDVQIVETEELLDEEGNRTGLMDVVTLQSRNSGQVFIENIPPEEFRINRGAKSLQNCKYCSHETTMTHSEIEDLGFEVDETLAGKGQQPLHMKYDRHSTGTRQFTRGTEVTGEAVDPSLKEYTVSENYLKVDWDGDGYAELRQIILVGDQVVSNEEVQEIPFVGWTPFMLTHRFEGMSLVDLTKDLQLIKTTITRNMLDNMYLMNNTRYIVQENMVNIDDLLNSKPGGYVRTKSPQAITPMQTTPLSPQSFQLLEMLDQSIERRTGVSDRLRGFDANLLSANQAASAVSQVLTAVEQRVEMIARRFGEEFLVPCFRKIHSQSIRHESGQKKFRLNDKFEAVNPSEWGERYDLRVVVGLGNGNKTERLFHLQQLFAAQQSIVAGGGLGTLVTPRNIHALQEDIVQLVDKTARNRYFADPGDIKGNEGAGEPTPQDIMAKQEQDRKDMELASEIEIEKMKLELEKEKLEFEKDKFEVETALKAKELEMEVKLESEQNRGVAIG